jgi:GTPase SAR1 family protein
MNENIPPGQQIREHSGLENEESAGLAAKARICEENLLDLKNKYLSLQDELETERKKIADMKSLFSSEEISAPNEPHIQEVREFIIDKLIRFLDELDIYPEEYELFKEITENLEYWINLKRKPWLEDKVVIAVMGKFSSGKSSIINKILGENLLPVDIEPATAVSTYISFGKELSIKYSLQEGSIRQTSAETFKSISKSAFDEINLASLIKYFVIEYPAHLNLRNISILDTPGYDSRDIDDKTKALAVVSECDYVFWIVDINDGQIKRDALEFIKQNLLDKTLYVIISKADTKPTPRQREDVREQIAETLTKAGIPFEGVILFSNKKPELMADLVSAMHDAPLIAKEDFYNMIDYRIRETKEKVKEKISALKQEIGELDKKNGEMEDRINTFVKRADSSREDTDRIKVDLTEYINKRFDSGPLGIVYGGNHANFVSLYSKFIRSYIATISDYRSAIDGITINTSLGIQKNQLDICNATLDKFEKALHNIHQLENEFWKLIN